MAARWISYCAIVTCLTLNFAPQSIHAIDFNFDERSCDSLLPNAQQSLVVASNEGNSPYRIDTPISPFDEGDKLFSVTLQGGDFNGFIIQARVLEGSKQESGDLGRFVNLPTGVKFLGCAAHALFRDDNTVISTDTSLKNSVKLTWKSESGHMKNIIFVATFVKDNTYWPNVKSNPLHFQIPPDFSFCGKETSCYRYSGTSEACIDDKCNFVFVSELGDDKVIFTLGGIITEPTGYIGVAHTNEKSGKLDLFTCALEAKDRLKENIYIAKDIESQPEKEAMINKLASSAGLDQNARQVWCGLLRHLQIPGSQLADLTQPQTMMFLRGP